MTSDADIRLAALEREVGEIRRAVRALEEHVQAIDGTLAKQARFLRYLEGQVQAVDERIRPNPDQ